MSIIASTYNTGTGLSTSVAESTLPLVVDDLTVNGNLTVIETTVLNGQTTINNNLNITGTTTSANAIVNNNLIITNGVGQNSSALIKLPLTNGTNGQVLTILNDALTPDTTTWTTPVNDYVQYNTSTNKISKVDSIGTTIINDLVLSNKIGSLKTQMFKLPTNTSSSFIGSVLRILDPFSDPITTEWDTSTVFNPYVSYNSTSKQLEDNQALGSSNITDLVVSSSIGSSIAQKFVLPSNSSTSTVGQVLSILNATTKTTQWITIPTQISDYLIYTPSTYELSRVLNGTPTIITSLTVNSALGRSTTQRFGLPSNCSTAPAGAFLSIYIASGTAPSTQWSSDYIKYNTTTNQLMNNVTGTAVAIDTLRLTTIGRVSNTFNLPTNTSTATPYSRLVLIDNITRNTTWLPSSGSVGYNTTTSILTTENSSGGIPDITNLVLSGSIGFSSTQKFVLPSNTSTATAGSVLRLNNATTKTTDWVVPAMIPTTTETSITTGVATASTSTVEMCRASSLTAGTYLITYYIDLDISTTTRVFSYRSYGISSAVGSLTGAGAIVGLCVGDSVPYTAPIITGTTPVRYIGSGVCVLTATTTLYLLVCFVYTGTTFNTKGTLRVTKLA